MNIGKKRKPSEYFLNAQTGDIFQITSREGVCYGQVLQPIDDETHIVAIFKEYYSKTPKDFTTVVSRNSHALFKMAIDAAVKKGFFAIINDAPIFKENMDIANTSNLEAITPQELVKFTS